MRLLLVGAALMVLSRSLIIAADPGSTALLHLPMFAGAAFALPLSRRGHRAAAALLTATGCLATTLPLVALSGGLQSPFLTVIFPLAVYMGAFAGWRWLVGMLLALIGGLALIAGPLARAPSLPVPGWAGPALLVEAVLVIAWCAALLDRDRAEREAAALPAVAQITALEAKLQAARAGELERIRHQATLTRVARDALAPEAGPLDGAAVGALDVEARSTLLDLCASSARALNAAGALLLEARGSGGWSVAAAFGPAVVRLAQINDHDGLRAAAARAQPLALPPGEGQPAELRSLGLCVSAAVSVGSPRRAWGLLVVVDPPEAEPPSGEDRQLLHSMAQLAAAVLARARDAEALRQKERELLRAQRMEPIGLLAGGIAHDFNNYMQVIISYAAVVRDAMAHDDPALEDLREIERAAERAGATARQLLDYGRKRAPRAGVHDLNELVQRNAVATGKLLGEQIRVELQLSPRPAPVDLDADELSQVLMNLMVNARDAMPAGGVLRLQTEVEPATRQVRLLVEDNGCGMEPETQVRIFEPFFTTKAEDRGTGLGLSTCAALVRGWGGQIQLRSAPGVGTTFELRLPLERRMAPAPVSAPAAPGASATPALSRRGCTILVVEDDEQVRSAVIETLRQGGYTILDAATPEQALAVANGRLVDLLLTDLVLPGMNGTELFRALQAEHARLSVLYITGYSAADIGRRPGAAVIPAGRLLTKPFRPSALLHHIEHSLADDAPVN